MVEILGGQGDAVNQGNTAMARDRKRAGLSLYFTSTSD
jgi:hypothetical protein